MVEWCSVSRLVTFGIGLAIVAVVATGVVGGGAETLQQAYAQENSKACPEDYTRGERGTCVAEATVILGGCAEGIERWNTMEKQFVPN